MNHDAARMALESVAVAALARNPARDKDNRASLLSHKYESIPSSEDQPPREFRYSIDLPDDHHVLLGEHLKQLQKRNKRRLIMTTMVAFIFFAAFYLAILYVNNFLALTTNRVVASFFSP